MKRLNMLLVMICTLAFFFAMTCVANGETVYDYDAQATLKYAEQHCEDAKEPGATKADCIEFARTCVKQGGVPQDTSRVFKDGTGYTVEAYVDYMIDSGYAELHKLTKRTHTDYNGKTYQYVHQEDNAGIVSPGDIILYKCTNKTCNKGYYHASICAPPDESGTYAGYYRYYAHNKSVNNKILCTIKCFGCKSEEELYVLHITSKENGYGLYEVTTTVSAKGKDYNTIKLTWPKVEDADGYRIFCKMTSKSFLENIGSTAKNTFEMDVPKDYYAAELNFAVRPYKEAEGKAYVGGLSNFASAYTVANKPTNVKVKLTDYCNIKVTWSKALGATGYIVEYQPKGSKKWSYLCQTEKLSAVKKGLAPGKQYTFRITPYTSSKYSKGQRKSTKYAVQSVYTLKTISKPTVKRTSATKVSVKWQNINGETGYQISQAATKNGTKVVLTKASANAKAATLSVKKGKHYYYKVRAYKTVDGKKVFGPWSSVKYL